MSNGNFGYSSKDRVGSMKCPDLSLEIIEFKAHDRTVRSATLSLSNFCRGQKNLARTRRPSSFSLLCCALLMPLVVVVVVSVLLSLLRVPTGTVVCCGGVYSDIIFSLLL